MSGNSHLGRHLGTDFFLSLSQTLLGQLCPPVTVGDEGLQVIHRLHRDKHWASDVRGFPPSRWDVTYIELKEQVSLLGRNFIICPKCQVMYLRALSKVHTLSSKTDGHHSASMSVANAKKRTRLQREDE